MLYFLFLVLHDVVGKMGIVRDYSPLQKNRSHLLKYLPQTQDELPKRSMSDSFAAAVIKLSNDRKLQDKYTTFLGQVRVGRLLENMDMFAGKTIFGCPKLFVLTIF